VRKKGWVEVSDSKTVTTQKPGARIKAHRPALMRTLDGWFLLLQSSMAGRVLAPALCPRPKRRYSWRSIWFGVSRRFFSLRCSCPRSFAAKTESECGGRPWRVGSRGSRILKRVLLLFANHRLIYQAN
jgi:hypothetical protein